MDLNQALLLVRQKYLEEMQGLTTGQVANQYLQACQNYPVVIAVATELWTRELEKGLP